MSNFLDKLTVSISHYKCYSFSYLGSWKFLALLYCLINLPLSVGGNGNQSGSSSCVPSQVPSTHDYFVEYGKPLELLCSTSAHNGSNLKFEVGTIYQSSQQPVNDTTIRLFVEKPHIQKTNYYCKDKATGGKCTINVVVDKPPQDVHDFKCVSNNFESLNCTWTSPRNTKCKINYTISVYGKAGKSEIDHIEESDLVRSIKLDTISNRTSYLNYLNPVAEKIVFYLVSISSIGHHEQNITIDHFAIVIPEIKNVIPSDITSHKAVLHWNISKDLVESFEPCGLDHEIQYSYTLINNSESKSITTNVNTTWLPPVNETYTMPLNLPFANTKYKVSVYLKSKKATKKSVQEVTIKTKSEIPLRPPETAPGAFYITGTGDNRTIFIYWKQLEEYEQCGSNFTYSVSITQGRKTNNILALEQQSSSFVTFNNHSFDTAEGLFVSVNSQNEVGLSKHSSLLYIPSEVDTIDEVRSFTSFYDNGTYELSWDFREDKFKINNFTLFWCQADEARKCVNKLGFEIIDARKRCHTKKLDGKKGFQFAISVNSGARSSGMVWTDCEMSKGTEVSPNLEYLRSGTLKDDPCVVSISWNMKCKRCNFIKGYNITLRKTSNDSYPDLIYQFKNDTEANSLIFTGLSYNTIYEISFTTSTIDGLKNEMLDDYNKFIQISNSSGLSLYSTTATFVLLIIFICVLVITYNKVRYMRDVYPIFPYGLEPTENCLSDHVKNDNFLIYFYNNITYRKCTGIQSEDSVRNPSKDFKETFSVSTKKKSENKNILEESPILRDRTFNMSTSTYAMPYVLEGTFGDELVKSENKTKCSLRVDKSTGYYLPDLNQPNACAQTDNLNAQEQSPLLGDQSIETGRSQNGYISSSMAAHVSPSYNMIGLTDFSTTNDSSDEENGLVKDESTGYYVPNPTQSEVSSAKTDLFTQYSAPTQLRELNVDEPPSLRDEDVRRKPEPAYLPNKKSVLTPSYSMAGIPDKKMMNTTIRPFIYDAPKRPQNITQSPAVESFHTRPSIQPSTHMKSSAFSVKPHSSGYVSHTDVLDCSNDRKISNLGYKSLDNLFEQPCSTKSLEGLACPDESGTPVLNKLPDGYCQFSFKP